MSVFGTYNKIYLSDRGVWILTQNYINDSGT